MAVGVRRSPRGRLGAFLVRLSAIWPRADICYLQWKV